MKRERLKFIHGIQPSFLQLFSSVGFSVMFCGLFASFLPHAGHLPSCFAFRR